MRAVDQTALRRLRMGPKAAARHRPRPPRSAPGPPGPEAWTAPRWTVEAYSGRCLCVRPPVHGLGVLRGGGTDHWLRDVEPAGMKLQADESATASGRSGGHRLVEGSPRLYVEAVEHRPGERSLLGAITALVCLQQDIAGAKELDRDGGARQDLGPCSVVLDQHDTEVGCWNDRYTVEHIIGAQRPRIAVQDSAA
ncbi:MAG: hypothetical protein COC22_01145 [Flavobacteriaceae bacterium]|nr:MAG: hypothetical protein COC22_01145 [Flavobacteriaceae bacterium]